MTEEKLNQNATQLWFGCELEDWDEWMDYYLDESETAEKYEMLMTAVDKLKKKYEFTSD